MRFYCKADISRYPVFPRVPMSRPAVKPRTTAAEGQDSGCTVKATERRDARQSAICRRRELLF